MFDFLGRLYYTVGKRTKEGAEMIDAARLKILTESAKYDVSCSSSGSARRNKGGLGDAAPAGICHSFTPDGRCIFNE